MHCLVEVLTCLAVTLDHLVGDDPGQKRPQLIAEGQVLLGQLDMGEIHQHTVTLLDSFVNEISPLRRRRQKSFTMETSQISARERLQGVTAKPPFETVVRDHGPTVYRVCCAIVGAHDADDAWSE